MRKLPVIGYLLFVAGAVFAAPWGAMADYDLPTPPAGHNRAESLGMPVSATPGERYLLRKVLSGQSIKVLLEDADDLPEAGESFQEKIQEAYNSWFFNAAKAIRKAGRTQEFADILPLLDRGIPMEFVEDGEDITFEFVDRKEIVRLCSMEARACYVFDGPKIYVPKNPVDKNTIGGLFGRTSGSLMSANLVHEIGHSLGLSDQYVIARDVNTHSIYHGQDVSNNIMNSRTRSLSCDDADGIVNLIDITQGTQRGGKKGWRSLCKKSKAYYVGGSQFGVGPYGIFINKEETAWDLQTYKDGVYAGSTPFTIDYNVSISPFSPLEETVLQRDLLGRPLEAKGTRGEHIYYMHLYDASTRLVTKNGKALLLEKTARYAQQGKRVTESTVFFGKNGRFAKIYALKSKNQGQISYTEGEGNETVSVQMWLNKKGISDESWRGIAADVPVASLYAPSTQNIAGSVAGQVEQRFTSQQKDLLKEQLTKWYQQLPMK